MTGRLVVMGSGETAPTMIKAHRALLESIGSGSAVLLDTPYGFQENAEEISLKARNYFAQSVGRPVEVLSWRSPLAEGLAREQALDAMRAARWVFAGPGSPTYALRQWRGTPLPRLLAETAGSGGVVVFASAAALTLGSHTVPVYEIYKAGETPAWVPGLDLVRELTGLPAVVIPHYDNAEGDHHDTRFCYLGARRLALLERELPADAFVLGVDEHTGCTLDLAARTVRVFGNGVLTIRRHGQSTIFRSGSEIAFGDLTGSGAVVRPSTVGSAVETPAATSLAAEADAHERDFAAALERRDAEACTAAILALEGSISDWSADTLTSPEQDHARELLRSMVVRLGELARGGAADPRAVVAPFVEALLAVRAAAREARDFDTSDAVRDRLAAAGIGVRDTPSGVEWSFAE